VEKIVDYMWKFDKISQVVNHMLIIGLEQEMIWAWCTLDISLKQMLERVQWWGKIEFENVQSVS
jgi:hypothetical protein